MNLKDKRDLLKKQSYKLKGRIFTERFKPKNFDNVVDLIAEKQATDNLLTFYSRYIETKRKVGE